MKRHQELLVVFGFLCSYAVVLKGTETEKKTKSQEDGVFEGTHDWQPLRRDQSIPRGLHVRINLQTGEREAKLLDREDDDAQSRQISTMRIEDAAQHHEFTGEELKRALHKMEDGFDSASEPEDGVRVTQQFRSYSQLKKELGEIKLDMKSEQQVINQLVNEYKDTINRRSGGSAEKKKLEVEESLLNQLEYLVHQIDNAVEFIRLNGVKDVAISSLNSTSWKVRYEATKLLGSAVQNNPKAQISTLETGAIPILLRVLALDSNAQVKSGALYALSCLIRRFPLAQKQFLNSGGLTTIVKQFNSDTSGQLKLQLKAINLIRDLIEEVRESESVVQSADIEGLERPIASERHRQQTELNLSVRLVEEGWCHALVTLLARHSEDVEVIELLSDGMSAVSRECLTIFKESERTISRLSDRYKNHIGHSDHDYEWIRSNLLKLLNVLHETQRDEL